MLIENEFSVAEPVDTLWAHLLDVERVAPCMPGAELTETVDDHTWKGKVNAKFGPVTLAFAGTVTIAERDDEAHRIVLAAKGMEQRGKGAATARVTSWLEPADGATTVKMQADITLTGPVAQLSRGLLPEVSKKLTREFADCLQSSMGDKGDNGNKGTESAAGSSENPGPSEVRTTGTRPSVATAAPVGGIRLGLSAIWSIIRNFFRRLFAPR